MIGAAIVVAASEETGAAAVGVAAAIAPHHVDVALLALDDPRRGEAGRIPGAAVLLLPAVLLALRRATRKAFARSR